MLKTNGQIRPTHSEGQSPWLLLYSYTQNAFHVEEATEYYSKSIDAIERVVFTDWLPVFQGTEQECREHCEILIDVRDTKGAEHLVKALKMVDKTPLKQKVDNFLATVKGNSKTAKKEVV